MCANNGCNNSSCGGCGPWTLPQGLTGPTGPTGTNGVGIENVSIDGDDHLIITLTDETEIDAGLLPTGSPGYTLIHQDNVESLNLGLAGLNNFAPAKTFTYDPNNPDHEILEGDTLRIVAEFEQKTGAGVPVAATDLFKILLVNDTIFLSPDDNTNAQLFTAAISAPGAGKLRAGCVVVEIEINVIDPGATTQIAIVKVFNGNTSLVGRKTVAIDFTVTFPIYIKDIAGWAQFPVNTIACKSFKIERHKKPV